jgi:hypothetical protein
MPKVTAVSLLVLVLAASTACRQDIARPQFLHPGTAPQQQTRAKFYDPYPEKELNQLGPPDGDGTRPREFSNPANETKRGQRSGFVPERFPGVDVNQ